MIRVKELSKFYGNVKALDSVTFDVNNGEILAFLGPNGAGKSTTMKIITCFMPPTSGTVEVDDFNIYENSFEIRKRIGYLPETNPLYYNMYVLDYLNFVAEIRKIPKEKRKERLDYIIDTCGLAAALTKDIGTLSRGYRQRVGLAQTLIHDPEILILDEPTLGLDPNQIIDITGLIRKIGKEKTVMVSTHILPWVESTCDKVVILNHGKVVAYSSFERLRSQYPDPQNVTLETIFHDLTIKNISLSELGKITETSENVWSDKNNSAANSVSTNSEGGEQR
ncbi:ATP-binding cassette domain-containing protein [bacterium]|nr:ATP-binding cassette domain-containing protein [bacterium]